MTEHIAAEDVETAPQVEDSTEAELANEEVVEATEPEEGVLPESGEQDKAFIPTDEMSDKVKKRINQLTWEKHQLDREWQAKYDELQAKVNQSSAPTETAVPTLAQFDYDEDKYHEALIEHKVQARMKEVEAKLATTPNQGPDPAVAAFQDKQKAYVSENADYMRLAQTMGNAVSSKAVEQFIVSSESGPKLHHHLLSNYSELSRIQSLPEWKQGAELAKLETKLSQVKPKAKSNAPAPIRPIQAATPSAASSSSPFPKSW